MALATLKNIPLDEHWLSGDRGLLVQLVEADPELKEILGREIIIAEID